MRNPRVGIRIGRHSWLSTGRSGPRFGTRFGRTWISAGRRGTRVGSGAGPFFANASLGDSRRPRVPLHRRPLTVGPVLIVFALFIIGFIAQGGHL